MWTWLAWALAAPVPRDIVGSGDCAQALSGPAPTAPAGALARAWCGLALDRPDLALDALPADDSTFGAYVRWQRARALVDAGRPAEARPLLEGIQLPVPLDAELSLLRARVRGLLDPADGVVALKELVPSRGPEAWLAIADLHEAAGSRPLALDALREAWVDARPGGYDAVAARRLEAAGALPGVEARGLLERRMASLKKANRHEEALALRDLLSGGEIPSGRDELLALAAARSRARDHAGAAALWSRVYGAPERATGPADALFDYALAHARTGDYPTAAVIYRRLIAQHPSSSQADFASFKLGYMHWDAGEVDRAVEAFTEHLGRYPASKHLDEALWFRAQVRWDTDRDAAVADLIALQTQRGGSSLAPGAAYWQAVARIEAGDEAGGRAALEKLVLAWPTSGYAWFAAARIGKRFPRKPDAVAPAPSATLAARPAWVRARAFTEAGLLAWARAELDTLSPSGADTLPMAWALHDAGAYRAAQKLACPRAGKPWQEGPAEAQQVCFPRPERAMVEVVAARTGLDPTLAYGVMVAESALDPLATSPVGARGLMQLMPEVAARLHPDLFPGRPFDPDDLYLAPYNVALGTYELGSRQKSLASVLATTSAPAVVASYNAGEEAVRRWLPPEGPAPAFDVWAEDISFSETRLYVKRVLGHAMTIRWVYGDP